MPRLLAVLGHTNSEDGTLSSTARLRCVAAAVYLQKTETAFLLTTGAYGDNFNRSPIPHGALLLQEITKQAGPMPGVAILGHTPTAFTEEDIYHARRAYSDHACDAVTFVTSQFHGARVTEIAKLVFRDCRVEIVLAQDGPEITDADRKDEIVRIARFRRSWVDLPLYSNGAAFPDHIYDNAMDQHKHSDSVSLAIVTGALVFSGYPHTKINYAEAGIDAAAFLAICGLVGLGLLALYLRFAAFAFIARLVLRGLELGWSQPGFSYNHDRFYCSRWPYLRFFRTSRVLAVITMIIVAINFVAAGIFALK